MPAIKALGEIALQVRDVDTMARFYEEVVGLKRLRNFPNVVFFTIADGYAGHTAILALFDRKSDPEAGRSTLDHLAFTIGVDDYASERDRLTDAGHPPREVAFDWVGWRSLFITDPEGNMVELVCRDPSMQPTWTPGDPDA